MIQLQRHERDPPRSHPSTALIRTVTLTPTKPGRRSAQRHDSPTTNAPQRKRRNRCGTHLLHSRSAKVVGTKQVGDGTCMNTDETSTTSEAIAATDDRRSRSPRRPGQTLACGWCGSPILLPARGRTPKWCSSSCRHRAWELTRAAASGHAAIQVVDRAATDAIMAGRDRALAAVDIAGRSRSSTQPRVADCDQRSRAASRPGCHPRSQQTCCLGLATRVTG